MILTKFKSSFTLPSDIGRVPYKISSGFAGFKADQWCIWTTVFSLSALREVLPDDLYTHWGLFVHACSILCSRVISTSAIEKSHALLVEFCQQFQVLYGNQNCTMNLLHLHCHLKECLYDYGPVYSFWLFSFERLNGIMGSYPTNNRSVEVQLMNKHLRSWQLKFTDNEGLSKIFCEAHETKGTLAQQGVESYEGDTIMYQELSNQALSANYLLSLQQSSNTDISILSQKYNCVFSSNEVESLNSLYKSIFEPDNFK